MSTNLVSEGRLGQVLCGGAAGLYRMAYREWGDVANPRVLVCVHGLTRNSRDFSVLATALSETYRVIAPDVAGRGESDFLADPMSYHVGTYVADMLVLLARLNVPQVDWLGTSMGGLIGMALASRPGTPIRRLILNDVGPTLSVAALKRIVNYVGDPYTFSNFETAQHYARQVFASFALPTEADWSYLVESSFKHLPSGEWRFNYDQNIRVPLAQALLGSEIDLWPVYEQIQCPTLLVHGALSDLLTAETAQAMTQRGPRATLATVAGVGHAPMFMSDDQIALVRDFLETA